MNLEEIKAAYARSTAVLLDDVGSAYNKCCYTRSGYSHSAFCLAPALKAAIRLLEDRAAESNTPRQP